MLYLESDSEEELTSAVCLHNLILHNNAKEAKAGQISVSLNQLIHFGIHQAYIN